MLARLALPIMTLFIAFLSATTAIADVDVAVNLDPGSAPPGALIFVEIQVSNTGNSAENGLVLELPFPAGMAAMNESQAVELADCVGGIGSTAQCNPGEVATWSIGTLGAGDSQSFFLSPTINGATADGTSIIWTASVKNSTTTLASDTKTLIADASAPLRLAVDADQDPVAAGGRMIYTLSYGNTDGANSTDTTLTFPLPAGTTFVSATDSGAFSTGVVQWDLGTLLAGATGQVQVIIDIGGGLAAGSLVEVDAAELAGTIGGLPETQQATHVAYIDNTANDLTLAVQVHTNPAVPDQRLDVELTVTNTSGSPVTGAQLRMQFPRGMLAMNESQAGGLTNCVGGIGSTAQCNPGEIAFWDLGDLAAGEARTLYLPPVIQTGLASGFLVNWDVSVSADNGDFVSESRTLRIEAGAPLRMAVDADQDPVAAGGRMTYTLTLGNTDGANSTDTTLTFPLPAGTTFVSATDGGAFSAGVVQWDLGTLLAGATGQVQVIIDIDGGLAAGSLVEVDAAELAGTIGGLPETQQATHVAYIDNTANDLSLAVQVHSNPAVPGQRLDVELTVTNTSEFPVTGAQLRLQFPAGINATNESLVTGLTDCQGVIGSTAQCNPGEIAFWDLGVLAAGEARTLYLPPVIQTGLASGFLVNWDVSVSADNGDFVSESRTLRIEAGAPLRLAVDADQDPVAAGGRMTYTLTFGNTDGANSTDTTLTFPLPAGTTFVSATDGGSFNAGTVAWDLKTLLPGAVGRVHVQADIADSIAAGTLVEVDAAELSGTISGLSEAQQATSVAYVDNTANDLQLTLVAVMNPTAQNTLVAVQVEVTNTSGSPVTGTQLRLQVPVGVNAFNESIVTELTDCQGGIGSTAQCNPGEIAFWDLGVLAANDTRSLSFSPTIGSSLDNGFLVNWQATVSADNGDNLARETTTMVSNAVFPDTDDDGIKDPFDNCPNVSNVFQEDYRVDNEGNVCDEDDDNDGIPDSYENLYVFLNPFNESDAGEDQDNDGLSNLDEYLTGTKPNDDDTDNDGWFDGDDNCPLTHNPDQLDTNSDGVGDACTVESGKVQCFPVKAANGKINIFCL